jgi:DNA helicase HerA-like ATPase
MIQLSSNLQIDLQKMTGQRLAVIGKSGSGKTHTLRVFAEEWIGAGQPCTIIDPMSNFGNVAVHLPVIVAGRGDGADIQITAANAAGLARMSVETRCSVVIDTSLYTEDETLEVLRVYLEAMWSLLLTQKQPQPYALVIDEAHLFAPQQGSTVLSKTIVDVAKRGRHKKLTTVIATQRAASIEKNFLTQATMLVAHRLTFGVDTKVLTEQLPLKSKDLNGMMRKLNTGEALVIGDSSLLGEADYLQVQIRPLMTTQPDDAPVSSAAGSVDMAAVRQMLDELKQANHCGQKSALPPCTLLQRDAVDIIPRHSVSPCPDAS